MKIKFDMNGVSLYKLAYNTSSWCNKTEHGNCLKQGRQWTDFRYLEYDVHRYEVHPYHHNDKINETYWLVEHKVLIGSGKARSLCTIEFTPLYPVEIIKVIPGKPERCIIKRKDW